jgi:hypothetical protein
LRVDLRDLLDVGRAGSRDDGLAFEVIDRLELRRKLRDEAVGGDKMRDGEGYLLLAVEIVGGGAAFEINRAICHQRNARRRGDRI